MTLESFMKKAISPWMREDGPENDIVLSTRIRLARNFQEEVFPVYASGSSLKRVNQFMQQTFEDSSFETYEQLMHIKMDQLSPISKRVLVEKHLISPYLVKAKEASSLISKNEQLSIMINEEDHLRIQLYFPGFQLSKGLEEAFRIDNWLEEKIDFAFDEHVGYLTSCPTNVGTGLRASVMLHLPALILTKQLNRMMPAINQLGFVVRGIYGEGSEALGNVFQVSNQITLGKTEEEIVLDLESVILKLMEAERKARQHLLNHSPIHVENKIYRAYGLLKHSRIMESAEAATLISHVRLGIDLGFIEDVSHHILNELIVLTQPGFLQHYAKKVLTADERDILRATFIRERLNLK